MTARFVTIITVAFAVFSFAVATGAQETTDPEAARLTTEVSQEIFSPFCPGKTLAMCPSPNAADVRRDIQKMAEAGMDKKQIKELVITEYGEEFRLAQPGVTDDVPMIGLVGFGLLLAILAVFLISRRKSAEREPTPTARTSDTSTEQEKRQEEADDAYLSDLRSQYRD